MKNPYYITTSSYQANKVKRNMHELAYVETVTDIKNNYFFDIFK